MIDPDSGLGADDILPRPLDDLRSELPVAEGTARLPRGFRVAGVSAGIKASGGRDLSVVVVDGEPAAVAATFTSNRLPAAPVSLNLEHLAATGTIELIDTLFVEFHWDHFEKARGMKARHEDLLAKLEPARTQIVSWR